MTTRIGILGVLAGCMAAALITQGCRDAGADERARVQSALAEAAGALDRTMVLANTASDEDVATARQKLTGIITTLNGIQGGEDGQLAARAMMAATAYRGLATLYHENWPPQPAMQKSA